MKRDHATVNRSPLNTSRSKQLVSFTKAQRFPEQSKARYNIINVVAKGSTQ